MHVKKYLWIIQLAPSKRTESIKRLKVIAVFWYTNNADVNASMTPNVFLRLSDELIIRHPE